MSFSDTIEALKTSITGLITKSADIKTTNLEKVQSINTKIISIKESVANIMLIRDQFKTVSESLQEANAKIADCELKSAEQIAAMTAAAALFDTQKKDLESQMGDKDKELTHVSLEYDKQLQNNAIEIASLNESLKNNIQEVQTISEEATNKLNDIDEHGKEIEEALTGVEAEIDSLQTDMANAEKAVQNQENNDAVQNQENNDAVVIDPITTGNAPEDEPEAIPPPPPAVPLVPTRPPPAIPEVVPTENPIDERATLIKKLRNDVKQAQTEGAEVGNFEYIIQEKDKAVGKLRLWDEANRGKTDIGAKYGPTDILPDAKKYMSSVHLDIAKLGGGSKKRKSTRKKRKTKKTKRRGRK
jgi:chromosome segregation ATPase